MARALLAVAVAIYAFLSSSVAWALQPSCANTVFGYSGPLLSGFAGAALSDPTAEPRCFVNDGAAVRAGYLVLDSNADASCCVERGVYANDLCNLGCNGQTATAFDFFTYAPLGACFHRCFGAPADVCVDAPITGVLATYDSIGTFPLGTDAGVSPSRTTYVINTTTHGLVSAYGLVPAGSSSNPAPLYCTRRGVIVPTDTTPAYVCELNACGSSVAAGFVYVGAGNIAAGATCYTDCYSTASCVFLDVDAAPLSFIDTPDCTTCQQTCAGLDPCYFYDFVGQAVRGWDVTCPDTPYKECRRYNSDHTLVSTGTTASCFDCRSQCLTSTGCAYYAFGDAIVDASASAVSVPCGNCQTFGSSFELMTDLTVADCQTCFQSCSTADPPCYFYAFDSVPQLAAEASTNVCSSLLTPNCDLYDESEILLLSIYTPSCQQCVAACNTNSNVCFSMGFPGYQVSNICRPT